MAITLKSTLLDLGLTEDDIEAHVLEIIQARPTGAERRSALSYIRQLVQRGAGAPVRKPVSRANA